MKKMLALLSAIVCAALISMPASASAAACGPEDGGLKLTNGASSAVVEFRLAAPESDKWGDNLLPAALIPGKTSYFEIGRDKLPGWQDVLVVFKDGVRKVWPNIPMTEVYSAAVRSDREPEFNRIRIGA